MSNVPKASPSTAPHQVELLFYPWPDEVPKPVRDAVTAIAEQIEIEGAALQVGAMERAGSARCKQLALFGLVAAAALNCDARGVAEIAQYRYDLESYRLQLRHEAFEFCRRRVKQGHLPPWQ